jgi:hypothetical protein
MSSQLEKYYALRTWKNTANLILAEERNVQPQETAWSSQFRVADFFEAQWCFILKTHASSAFDFVLEKVCFITNIIAAVLHPMISLYEMHCAYLEVV